MSVKPRDLGMTPLDDLFSTDESRAEAQLEKVIKLNPDEISDFPNHPFTLVGFGTTANAAEETDDVYLVSFPRSGDANYNGEWGHGSHTFMNGWSSGTSRFTTVRAMGSYEGNICYCIEVGVPQETGDSYTKKGEDFWDNYPSSYNNTLSPDDIKLYTETAASFYNERQKAAVTLDKILEQNEQFGIGANGEITAVTFGLFAAEDVTAADGSVIPADGLLEILSVDESGYAVCKTDLPFGSFYFKELSTDEHYILSDKKYPFEFSYMGQDTAIVEIKANDGAAISNNLIYGEIHGMKKDENGNALGGAIIGLFKPDCTEFITENAIVTAISAEDGSFSFANVPYGNWVVCEIEAPTGFVLSEESFAVTIDKDGAIIEVEIENTLIRGNVQLTKTDKDYPENKLTGAKFAVYRDSNGDKAFDENDEKIGELSEVSTGVYEMHDLTYGGYFVKEQQAPEGFYLDENTYYFEITEHGKTITVENETGKGFVNTSQVGSLKIVKTSSDGKVEGFSFRVTGSNGYSEVFVTDENGEIFIENLRIGDYTVSEVSDGASAAYVLPADKTASVFEGAVTTVEMHNELRDTPKTGDDRNSALWLSLLGISAAGAAVLGVIGLKKKSKKEDAE